MKLPRLPTISRVFDAPTVELANQAILALVLELTEAEHAAIYTLSVADGEYHALAATDVDMEASRIPALLTHLLPEHEVHDLLSITARTCQPQVWSRGDATKPSRHHRESTNFRSVFPLIKNTTAIGLIDIQAQSPLDIPSDDALDFLSTILGAVLDRRAVDELLQRFQEPLDLTGTRNDYFHSLADLVHRATGYEFVAIREPQDSNLRCVAQSGFTGCTLGELDLKDDSLVAPFVHALQNQETTWRASTHDPDLKSLRTMSPMRFIQGFIVTPLFVGNTTTGVLSAATRCYFEPSYQRLEAFRALGNAVALAIENFKNFHSTTGEIQDLVSAAHSALSTVIMQSTRHSALGHLGQAQSKLALAMSRAKGDTRLSELLRETTAAVEQGKDALKLQRHRAIVDPKTTNPEEIRLDLLLADVKKIVDGQLKTAGINWRVDVRATKIYVIPDVLPIAFLQLVENTVEAFNSSGARAENRSIRWHAEEIDGGRRVRLTYSDNATGINPRQLKIPDSIAASSEGRDWRTMIFEPGVTSKKEGTGWGLYYVRLLISRASAGQPNDIMITDWRGGVTFQIELPCRPV